MNLDRIPLPDMLGLPAQPIIIQILMAATLALHWFFIGGAFGGSVLVLINSLKPAKDIASSRISSGILAFLPFMLSMGMTLGIAPLLFVQLLYGNFFYSSNVLIAWWWLLIVPLVIGNMYLFYIARNRLTAGKKLGAHLPALMIAFFMVLAAVLVSNAVLSQTPTAWEGAQAKGPTSLFMGTFVGARLLFALFGLVAGGGLFVAILGKAGQMDEPLASARALRQGLFLTVVSIALQFAAGAWLFIVIKPFIREGVLVHWGFIGGVTGLVITLCLTILTLVKQSWFWIVTSTLAYVLAGIGMAFARDAWRQSALEPYFQVSQVPVNPQWGPFGLFAFFLLLCIAALTILIRLACSPKASSAN